MLTHDERSLTRSCKKVRAGAGTPKMQKTDWTCNVCGKEVLATMEPARDSVIGSVGQR